ncbi:MAG: hypothetical protein ABJF10_02070 [Chthoniobacter sp.]|uniref:hypothetical protein n=1 Tax=Chthoniobacter sp. TaxID=2510640 RepID=UPI0032A7CD98
MIINRQAQVREALVNRHLAKGGTLITAFLNAERERPDLFRSDLAPLLQLSFTEAELLGETLLREITPKLRPRPIANRGVAAMCKGNVAVMQDWIANVEDAMASHSLFASDAWNLMKGRDLAGFVAYVQAATGDVL